MRKTNSTRYCILLTIVLLPAAMLVNAQKRYELVTEAGVSVVQGTTNDSLIAGDKTNGTGLQFHLRVAKTGTKRKTLLQGSYSFIKYDGSSNEDIRQHGFSLSLSDGYNILSRKNKYFSLYEGYFIATQAGYSPGSSSGSYSWNSYNGIGWYQSLRYADKKNTAELDVQVPLAGVVYRTPAASDPNNKGFDRVINSVYSHPAFASLHNNKAVEISLRYARSISDRLSLSANYQFKYQQWEGENSLINTAHIFGISVGYRLP